MGTKILLLCWIALVKCTVQGENIVIKTGHTDNISAESVSRLYRNAPLGVYASGAPYAAYSFNVPTVLAPKNIPVKEETILVQNTNGFLKDSYGNQYLQSPQALAYRTTFPRQFVQLQNLPAHLSQPLVAPGAQFKQSSAHFFSPTHFSVQGSPHATLSKFTVQQPALYGNTNNFAPNQILYTQYQPQAAQLQSASNKNIYSNLNNAPQFQRLQEAPKNSYHNNDESGVHQSENKPQPLQQAARQTITTLPNGKKIAINLVTKPPVPLLDLSLLEPLTFTNPLVPQVQHYLPRINDATYHKLPNGNLEEVKKHQMEFVVQNTKSYDSDDNPKKNKTPNQSDHSGESEDEILSNPNESVDDNPNENPEITYEINSPNYKETYTEQKVNYNKETESDPKTYTYESKTEGEPVHYSYEKNTEKKPVSISYEHHIEKAPIQYSYEEQTQKEPIHYSYVKTSKEPVSHVQYPNNNQSPKHLVYTIKPEEKHSFDESKRARQHPEKGSGRHSENSHDNNRHSDGHNIQRQKNHDHQVHYISSPQSNQQLQPEHRHVQYYHTHDQQDPNIAKHHNHPRPVVHQQRNIVPIQQEQKHFQPIVPEYEEDIKLLPPQKPHGNIRVNPNQHIQPPRNAPPRPPSQPANEDSSLHYPEPQIINGQPKPQGHDEEEEKHESEEEVAHPPDEEISEEDFEKNYKDAAFGFAAYDASHHDTEKDIYNPASYGTPRYHSEYNIEKSPFQQYEADGDEFPKFSRLNYKDERDKMHEDYFLDYAINKPTVIRDSFRNKENYYKMFKKNKPQYYSGSNDEEKQNAKYTSVPSFEYHVPQHKHKQHFTKEKSKPYLYEYDSREEPRDASAHATHPFHRYKSKTQFVEPQFQYGFEPISIPQLLDSELAAMASNDNPKSDKNATRKKIYKENLYIKKTSTKGGKRVS